MPLFEFECADCHAQVEILVRGTEAPVCPKCASSALQKRISVPAHPATNGGRLPVGSSCPPSLPPCGPGCCRLPG